jgi:hypothetical protein
LIGRDLKSSTSSPDNMAEPPPPQILPWACFTCNKKKGPNLSGIDGVTGKLVPLFHPRRHKWSRHFRWQGALLAGRTPIGRATIAVLGINQPLRVRLRQELIDEGVFPTG